MEIRLPIPQQIAIYIQVHKTLSWFAISSIIQCLRNSDFTYPVCNNLNIFFYISPVQSVPSSLDIKNEEKYIKN